MLYEMLAQKCGYHDEEHINTEDIDDDSPGNQDDLIRLTIDLASLSFVCALPSTYVDTLLFVKTNGRTVFADRKKSPPSGGQKISSLYINPRSAKLTVVVPATTK